MKDYGIPVEELGFFPSLPGTSGSTGVRRVGDGVDVRKLEPAGLRKWEGSGLGNRRRAGGSRGLKGLSSAHQGAVKV